MVLVFTMEDNKCNTIKNLEFYSIFIIIHGLPATFVTRRTRKEEVGYFRDSLSTHSWDKTFQHLEVMLFQHHT
jgi:hypothetical protein